MDWIRIVILIFSLAGALDYFFGNRLGLGAEFERAFLLFRAIAFSMLGMLVIAPLLGEWMTPVFDGFYRLFGLDPSILPASLFANDMGGQSLAQSVCKTEAVGNYNAYVVSSMMGCVVSFTVPFSLGIVKEDQHRDLFFGFLCGIATIPVGCFVAGLCCGLGPLTVLADLLPLLLISALLAVALILAPKGCIRWFARFGRLVKFLSLCGLGVLIVSLLTGKTLHPALEAPESAVMVGIRACVTLSGTLPLMAAVSRLLEKPLRRVGARMGINGVSALALPASLVSNSSAFGVMEKMDRRGVVLNAAFAVSASFSLGSHLAFTMAMDPDYVGPMVVGKCLSGLCALVLALVLLRRRAKNGEAIE